MHHCRQAQRMWKKHFIWHACKLKRAHGAVMATAAAKQQADIPNKQLKPLATKMRFTNNKTTKHTIYNITRRQTMIDEQNWGQKYQMQNVTHG